MTTAIPHPPFRVRTIYSWSGAEEDDLGFIEGDIIEVDDLGDGNWWHGRLKRNRMTGNFPSNYVELIKSDLPSFSASMRAGLNNSVTNLQKDSPSSSRMQSASPHSRDPHPNSPYSSPSPSNPYPPRSQARDDMQFSFQSSKHYYADTTENDMYAPQSPYKPSRKSYAATTRESDSYQLPHSRSVPVKLEGQTGYQAYTGRPKLQVNTRNQHSSESFGSAVTAPPPPHHSLPVKSQSSVNLRSNETYSPESPYSRTDPSARRSALLKQATSYNGSQGLRDSGSTNFVAPYDPNTLNQSRSTISQGSNVFSYSNGSYFSSSQSSHNSSFAMSDFSATSAGSYARHKHEDDQRRSDIMKTSASGNNLMVEEKRVKNSTSILRRFFTTKDAPPLPKVETLATELEGVAIDEKKLNSWIEVKIDLNRANSLSSKERQMREKRVRESEGYIIFEPHKQLSTINSNEVYQTENKLHLQSIELGHVDRFVRNLKATANVMSPEAFITNELGMKFSSKLEYLRALFILCTEHFQIVDSRSNEEPTTIDFDEIFRTRHSSAIQLASLFHHLSRSMGLKSELVVGSLKTPQSIIRHAWNAVLINGEWRFIDTGLGNLTHPLYGLLSKNSEDRNESFYFLVEPLDLIYTHIPDKYEEQHIVPPIDSMVALALPPCFPSFFKNGLSIQKFSNALTRLKDFEIFEIDLKIPKDIDVDATVFTKNSNVPTLSQVYWKHNERYCKVKGHLPDNASTGFINIFSSQRGSSIDTSSLSIVIPITHEGEYRPLEFVIRYPTALAQLNDLYIKQPQNRNLAYGADYVFSVLQHPSSGLTSGSPITRSKVALQSPSGKVIKFSKKDQSTPFGLWELPIKCSETGVWRGLVSVDSGSSLCVFAEWHCR